jgi:hypothetical protein
VVVLKNTILSWTCMTAAHQQGALLQLRLLPDQQA